MNLISVWGSSGAGKTTVALAVAAALAKKEDVLVLSTDSRTPALPIYLPMDTKLTTNQSLGGLLDTPGNISESSLKDRLHQHPKNRRLYFAGYASGELPGITYKPVSRDASITLLQLLQHTPFHYVIIDCDSSPAYDSMTLAALEHARVVLRVLTPDVKGYEFQKAQMAWMSGSPHLHVDRHIRIANPVFPYTSLNEAKNSFGNFSFSLPYAQEVAARMAAGQLLQGFGSRTSIDFERRINAIAQKIRREGADDGD